MEILVKYEGSPCYNISINPDYSILKASLGKIDKTYKRACVITDSNVEKLHLQNLLTVLGDSFEELYYHIIPAGEQNKNLDQIALIYKQLIETHFDRNDLLIAFGGGVIGDMTGFTAATYLRGIDFIQIPTTLLAMVDSSVGGKTGVDCMQYKNMVGAFYMPKLVYMNLSLLETLPSEQFACGMGEVIKTACIRDAGLLHFLMENKGSMLAQQYDVLSHVICTCCDIKRSVVEEDPKEKGIRAILNFGHTIGHAIEKLSDFELYHGQCVAIGMMSALYISEQTGHIDHADMELVTKILKAYNLPISYDLTMRSLSVDDVFNATKSDKKMAAGKIKFIRLDSLGNAVIDTELAPELIKEAIEYVLKEH